MPSTEMFTHHGRHEMSLHKNGKCDLFAAGLHNPVGSTFCWRCRDCKFRQITFMQIDHEIISMVILPLPRIQGGQFSVTGKSTCICKNTG